MAAFRCFHCMQEIADQTAICTHCGYNNHIREVPPGALCNVLLNDQYLLGRVLGRGGFGITYLGYDYGLERIVAIKEFFPVHLVARETASEQLSIISESADSFQKGRASALRESRLAASMAVIPGIVQVHNVLSANNTIYIIMEYVDGCTLEAYVKQAGRSLSFSEVMALLSPIAKALCCLHSRNVIHRDVKPSNIMIRSGSNESVLLDFGAARVQDGSTLSHSAAVVSQGYTPIEQYTSQGLDSRIDEYAFCATLYFALTGEPPKESLLRLVEKDGLPPIVSFNSSISSAAQAVIMKGLSVEANDRYPTFEAMWTALTALSNPKPQPHSGKMIAAIALIVVVLGLAAVLGSGILEPKEPQKTEEIKSVVIANEIDEPIATHTFTPVPAATPTPSPAPTPASTPTSAPPVQESAGTLENGLNYAIHSDGTAEITIYSGDAAHLTVPDRIDDAVVTKIGDLAFSNCSSLKSIELPDSLTEIVDNPFRSCSSDIILSSDHPVFAMQNGMLIDKKNHTIVAYVDRSQTEVAVPDGVTSIGNYAFYGCHKLTSILIPDGVTSIGIYAFAGCSSLNSIELPESIAHINTAAFESCFGLKTIYGSNDVAKDYAAALGVDYVDLTATPTPTATSTPTPASTISSVSTIPAQSANSASPKPKTMQIVRITHYRTVNVRSGPSADYQLLGEVQPDNTFLYLGTKDGWNCIQYTPSEQGYVSGKLSAVEWTIKTESGVPEDVKEYVLITHHKTVNVRTGPGQNYECICEVKPGSIYPYMGTSSGWHLIELDDGKTGYVSGNITTVTGTD